MARPNVILLCAVLAMASAKPWYTNSYNSRASLQHSNYGYERPGYFSPAMPQAIAEPQPGKTLCQSASHQNGNVNAYVHICEDDGQYCFISNGVCCLLNGNSQANPDSKYLLSLGNNQVTVEFYSAGGAQGVCYHLDKEIPVCNGCQKGTCVETRCIGNTFTGDVTSCDNNGCRCRKGFAPPDCCKCDLSGVSGKRHYLAEDGTCKPLCNDFCASPITINGCSSCLKGYKTPDCCDCDTGYYKADDKTCIEPPCPTGVSSCSGGVCTCHPPYTGRDCCQCAPGYYRATDGTCKPPCTNNIQSCTNGLCTCKSPYIGADCCDVPRCDMVQDIYFVIDATVSNGRLGFCQTHYGMELMITAMNPSNSLSGTRIGGVFYPKADLGQHSTPANNFFNLGTGCEEAVGNYNTMIDGFYNTEFDNRYKDSIRGIDTYPAPALKLVAEQIEAAGIRARRRIVVVITDGFSSGNQNDLSEAVKKLNESAQSVTIIAAGNDLAYRYNPTFRQKFVDELELIAGTNTIVSRDSTQLAIELVQKMESIGALCEDKATEIVTKMQADADSLAHCYCIDARGEGSGSLEGGRCRRYCKSPRSPADCRSPPTCSSLKEFGATIQGNPYYDSRGSNPYNREVAAEYNQPMNTGKEDLENDILAAVEEVLRERMEG